MLYIKKPQIAPTGKIKGKRLGILFAFIIKIIAEKQIKQIDAQRPFNPSIILKAFMMPTTQNTVKGIPK